MAKFEPHSAVMKYFGYRMAIIQVKYEESKEEAWERHLMETPDDINATIRIFNI
jgi:hypothetical protein